MRAIALAVCLSVILAFPISAQSFGPEPDAATRRELLTLRERAWRSWFANDSMAFKQIGRASCRERVYVLV